MPKLSFSRTVGHTPGDMLELVADVRRYPEFVPNCTKMEVWAVKGEPETIHDARMHIRFGPIAQAYTSRVTVDRDKMSISAHALDGPFEHLDSLWSFVPHGQGADIRFEIDFKVRNPLLAAAMEPAFANKQAEIVDAFVTRAGHIYG